MDKGQNGHSTGKRPCRASSGLFSPLYRTVLGTLFSMWLAPLLLYPSESRDRAPAHSTPCRLVVTASGMPLRPQSGLESPCTPYYLVPNALTRHFPPSTANVASICWPFPLHPDCLCRTSTTIIGILIPSGIQQSNHNSHWLLSSHQPKSPLLLASHGC